MLLSVVRLAAERAPRALPRPIVRRSPGGGADTRADTSQLTIVVGRSACAAVPNTVKFVHVGEFYSPVMLAVPFAPTLMGWLQIAMLAWLKRWRTSTLLMKPSRHGRSTSKTLLLTPKKRRNDSLFLPCEVCMNDVSAAVTLTSWQRS